MHSEIPTNDWFEHLEMINSKLTREVTKFSNKSQVVLDQVKNIFYPDTTKFTGEPFF